MGIGWLAVLQLVPWTDVVRNAPKVAEGAKKLWSAIARKGPAPGATAPSARTPEAQSIGGHEARLKVLEAMTAELHEQLLASSELIKALAEQNTQLVARIEANRVRVLWLFVAVAISGLVAVCSLAILLLR
jgi:hypothetical protein